MARSGAAVLLVGLIAFGVGLIIYAPASWIWPRLAVDIPLQVSSLQGTMWQGQAVLGPERAPQQLRLRWQFVPSALWQRQLAWQLHLGNAETDLQVLWRWQASLHHAQLQGHVHMAQFEPWLYPRTLGLSGRLQVPNLSLWWQPHAALSAEGELNLSAGQIRFNGFDGQRYETQTLNVQAVFARDAQAQTQITLMHRDAPITYITAELSPAGRLRYQLLSPIREVVPFDIPGGTTILLDADIPLPLGLP